MSYFIRVATPADTTTVVPQYWERQIVSPTQSNIYYNDGYVGLGVPNPLSRLAVDGGATVGVNYYNTAVPDGVLLCDQVGIGTTNPTTLLDVMGNSKYFGNITLDSGVGLEYQTNIYFKGGSGDTAGNIFYYPTANNNDFGIQFKDQNTYTNTTFGITTDNETVGDLGAILAIRGDTGVITIHSDVIMNDTLTVNGNMTVNGTQTIINTETVVSDQMLITNSGTGSALVVNQIGTEPIAEFQDDGATVLKIVNGGDVGIGTDTPANKLDVVGNIQANKVKLNSVAVSATPSGGHIEYDGKVFEGSVSANYRGLVPMKAFHTIVSPRSFTNVATAQQIFANNITLDVNITYYFKMLIHKVRTASAGTAVAHTLNMSFTGTASLLNIAYTAIVSRATANNTPTATTSVNNTVATDSVIGASFTGLNEYTDVILEGIIRTGATSGTFIPNLRYSVAPVTTPTAYTDTIQRDCYITYYPIGIDTVVNTGDTWV